MHSYDPTLQDTTHSLVVLVKAGVNARHIQSSVYPGNRSQLPSSIIFANGEYGMKSN